MRNVEVGYLTLKNENLQRARYEIKGVLKVSEKCDTINKQPIAVGINMQRFVLHIQSYQNIGFHKPLLLLSIKTHSPI